MALIRMWIDGHTRRAAMVSGAEACVARSVRAILAELAVGAEIPDSVQFRDFLSGLNWFVPEVLIEFDPKCACALDGVCSARARKTGDWEAEVAGVCWILPECSLEPLHVWLQVAESKDEVCWLLCYFGVKHEGERKGRPPRSMHSWLNRMMKYSYLEGHHGMVDWAYKVTFGDRRAQRGKS